jgi:transcriptional regulator with XRE-family HTH domain
VTPADIRALRRALSLTQYELSNLVGVTRLTIVRWESDGGPQPRPSHLRKLRELMATTLLKDVVNA